MHIAFGTPFGGVAHPEHYRRKAIVQASALGHTFSYIEIDLVIVSKARNSIMDQVPPQVDVLWFVDADVNLPPNAHILLDHLADNPLVSGLYFSRSYPHLPQVYNRAGAGSTNFAFLPFINLPTEPFYADAVGAGCLLMHMDLVRETVEKHAAWRNVVETWQTRWLKRRQVNEETLAIRRALELGVRLDARFEFLEQIGEDFYFCESVRYHTGARPLVDPRVECEHVGLAPVTRKNFMDACTSGQVQFTAIESGKGNLT